MDDTADHDDDLRMSDRVAIIDQLHAYARLVDLNRPHEVIELFTDDGRANYHRGEADWLLGRVAIQRFLARSLAMYEATNHTVTNVTISFTGDHTADSYSYVQAWHRAGDGRPDFLVFGRYEDHWLKTDRTWRMSERRFKSVAGVGRSTDGHEPIGRASSAPNVEEEDVL